MTKSISRRGLLAAAAGGAAFAALPALPAKPALAVSDEELAYANFSVSSELLLADLYEKALAGTSVTGDARSTLRICRHAALQHARALSGLLAGAGQDAPTAEDFAFQWPDRAFATPAATGATARTVLQALLGVYQTAVTAVSEPSYRTLYASLAASIGQQLGALTALGLRGVVEPFPVAVDLERASSALEPYLG
ncbi:MAG: ferritin-like domain-containing protein [Gaiella sp.]|nr:ferritin-like domain-containing protein [Gaiella sp.]